MIVVKIVKIEVFAFMDIWFVTQIILDIIVKIKFVRVHYVYIIKILLMNHFALFAKTKVYKN